MSSVNLYAKIAESYLKARKQALSFVAIIAKQRQDERPELIILFAFAKDVELNMKLTNTGNLITAKVVAVQLDGTEDVYNMEVLGTHNFAVNGGLIVHNCVDAMRYFVQTRRIWRDRSSAKYRSIIG